MRFWEHFQKCRVCGVTRRSACRNDLDEIALEPCKGRQRCRSALGPKRAFTSLPLSVAKEVSTELAALRREAVAMQKAKDADKKTISGLVRRIENASAEIIALTEKLKCAERRLSDIAAIARSPKTKPAKEEQ